MHIYTCTYAYIHMHVYIRGSPHPLLVDLPAVEHLDTFGSVECEGQFLNLKDKSEVVGGDDWVWAGVRWWVKTIGYGQK